ncbi:hypothetical protein, partial [Streptosporangium sp. NPDC049644]|uniref:hypothetical protein n=1 Tax=Streptosporangium sp. NPDC049644 TaxID=3155507 RepID=UPI00342072A2
HRSPVATGTGLPLEPTFRTKGGSAVDSLSDAHADGARFGACTTLRTFPQTRGWENSSHGVREGLGQVLM